MVLKRGLLVLVSCSLVLWFSARHPTWGSACLILVSPDFAPSAMCEMIDHHLTDEYLSLSFLLCLLAPLRVLAVCARVAVCVVPWGLHAY